MRYAAGIARGLGVSVLLGALLVGCDDSDPPDRPATTPTGPAMPDLADGCPADDTPLPYPPDGVLPEGAVAVRLCNGIESFQKKHTDVNQFQPPADELTTDVDQLVTLVNELPDAPGERVCTAEAGPDLVFWFRYESGRAHAVRYGHYGCRTIEVGERQPRMRGELLHTTFADLLARQREGMTPALDLATPSWCADYEEPLTALDVVPALDLEVAFVCQDVDGRVGYETGAALTADQVRRINEAWDPQPYRGGKGCPATPFFNITGYTAWGDLVSLMGTCRFSVPELRRTELNLEWVPPPDVMQMIREAGAGDAVR